MGATKGQNARETRFRWIVLLLMCICIYSFVYCEKNPGSLQNKLMSEYGISAVQYSVLSLVYQLVNLFAPPIAAICIDSLGIYTSTLGFYILIFIGQSIFILGSIKSSYATLIIGRAILGAGSESYHTSRKWLAFEYFTTVEYMLASGLTLSASRFASASESYATTNVYEKHGIPTALSIGWILVLFSLILTIIFTIYQKIYYKRDENKSLSEAATKTEKQIIKQQSNDAEVVSKKTESDELSPDDWDNKKPQEWSKFQFNTIIKCKFDCRFWVFGLLLITFYGTYMSWHPFSSGLIQSRYQKTLVEANNVKAIPFWIAAIFTPIQGFICDYYGKRMPFMITSGFCFLFGNLFVCFIGNAIRSDGLLIFGLILIGFGYAIGAGTCWPCCGIIVKQKYLATALGFWACVDNGFQALCIYIIGAFQETYSQEEIDKESPNPVRINEYNHSRYLWIVLSILILIWTLILWCLDKKYGNNILMLPEEKYFIKRGLHNKAIVVPKDEQEMVSNEQNDMETGVVETR
eukprot:963_1